MKTIALIVMIVGVGMAENETAGTNPKIRRVPFVGLETGPGFKELFTAEPVTKNWTFQGLMYSLMHDGTETHERTTHSIGFVGASRALRWRRFEASLGAGLYGGSGQPFGPAFFTETGYKSRWWKGEVVLIQNIRKPADRLAHQTHKDKYLIGFIGPQFRCWSKAEDQTCQVQFGVDQITNHNKPDPLWGGRVLVPVPKVPHTKVFAKFLTGEKGPAIFWGLEFRPN